MQKPMVFVGALGAAILVVVVAMFAFKSGNTGEIRDLARNGANEAAMTAVVEKSAQPYKLSADDIISMKKDGVPDSIIVKMIEHKR